MAGFVFSNKLVLKGDVERFGFTYVEPYLGGEFQRDTILKDTVDRKLSLPLSISLSYSVGKNEKWQISASYSFTAWENFKNIYGSNEGLNNNQSVSFGAFICPVPIFDKTLKNDKFIRYLKSIRYSAGINYNTGSLNIFGHKISETAIAAGFGFPFYKKMLNPEGKSVTITSRIFLTGEYVLRGSQQNNLIQEDFFRFTLGLNFGDSWFRKRKFN